MTGRIALLALALCVIPTGGRALAADTKAPRLQVVARNLDNPRKLFVASDGVIYVVQAGSGGNKGKQLCLRTCVGETGSVVKVAHSVVTPVLTGLGSQSLPGGQDAQGPVAAMPAGSRYVVLMQDMQINSRGVNQVGLPNAGDLLSSPGGKLSATLIADLAKFEAEHNPDHGAGPGPSYAQPSIDSDPYGFVPFRGGYAVVDAAGNDLLQVDPTGKFPCSPSSRRTGSPSHPGSASSIVRPLPGATSAIGAELAGGRPGRRPLRGRVHRLAIPGRICTGVARPPGKKPTVFASGFTNIADLGFDGRDLIVLELASKGLQNPASTGTLMRLGSNGTRTVLAATGLVEPTGLAVAGGWIYVSNYGTYPAVGAGPHGELVRIRA